jgi:alanine dehydrogenase
LRAKESDTLILTRRDVREMLDMRECIDAVERAFHLHGSGQATAPAVASVPVSGGGFHMKAGVLPFGDRLYFVAKTNGNFPGNPQRNGLPTVQGTLVVCDGDRGSPLAVMDANEITALRTAAATAVAAKHLARQGATKLAIIGCGLQGHMHVQAFSHVMTVTSLALFDTSPKSAEALAQLATDRLGFAAAIAASPGSAARGVDVCVTCTTSREFLLHAADVDRGAFVAGVGVDWEQKRELAPDLLSNSRVVVDVLGQCAAFGDLHHAIEAGVLTASDVHAELGEVVAGRKRGRESDDDLIVFDSTGMALQDVAAAALVYERAVAAGRGTRVTFNN